MNEFIKKLEPFIDVRKDFKEWFNNDGQEVILMDLQTFIKLPFILQIGIWLKYLQDNNLQVSVFHRAWEIYYIDNHKITHHQYVSAINQEDKDSDTRFLDKGMDAGAVGYINSIYYYEVAIFKGLEYIDKTIKFPPF